MKLTRLHLFLRSIYRRFVPYGEVHVEATRDFCVGPKGRTLSIRKGNVRMVKPDSRGQFWTETDTGSAFGICTIGDGWVIISQPK